MNANQAKSLSINCDISAAIAKIHSLVEQRSSKGHRSIKGGEITNDLKDIFNQYSESAQYRIASHLEEEGYEVHINAGWAFGPDILW